MFCHLDSPFHFCKIVHAFVGFLRHNSIHIVSYVDDFILAANAAEIECQKDWVRKELGKLVLNLARKSPANTFDTNEIYRFCC